MEHTESWADSFVDSRTFVLSVFFEKDTWKCQCFPLLMSVWRFGLHPWPLTERAVETNQ